MTAREGLDVTNNGSGSVAGNATIGARGDGDRIGEMAPLPDRTPSRISRAQFDTATIRHAASGRWLEIIPAIDPSAAEMAKTPGRHGPCPSCGGKDRFRFFPDAAETGGALCNQCCPNGCGDGFEYLEHFLGLTFPSALARVGEYLTQTTGATTGKVTTSVPNGAGTARLRTRQSDIRATWTHAEPGNPQIVAYLKSRGLTIEPPDALRLAPLDYYENGVWVGTLPTMMAPVTRPEGTLVCIHKTHLRTDGRGKAQVSAPKKLSKAPRRRATVGAAIRLYPVDRALAVGEGIETVLAVREATGIPVWSAISANGLAAVEIPPTVDEVEIWSDVGDVGEAAATKLAGRLTNEGRSVKIISPPQDEFAESFAAQNNGKRPDWLDRFVGLGPDDLRQAKDGAIVLRADLERLSPKPRSANPSRSHIHVSGMADRPDGINPNSLSSHLPVIVIHTDEKRVNDEAIDGLGADTDIYQRGRQLVCILTDDSRSEGIAGQPRTPRIVPMAMPVLRERMAAAAKWVRIRENDDGDQEDAVHPPPWSVSAVFSRGQWPGIRPLQAVINYPILRRDGTTLSTPGYDPCTGLFLSSSVNIEVPDQPTPAQVQTAVETLREIVSDFPFAKPAHMATWVAFFLTLLSRFAFDGPAPLFLCDANTRGSGKSLLCDLVSLALTGREIPRMSNPRDDDEARKRITALAINGDSMVMIDNVNGLFGGPSLDAALTANSWKDRILGRSTTVDLPLVATWCATGNNVQLTADTSRRTAWIRLESPHEHPERRGDFKYPDIRNWVRQNRARIVSAGLTILRGFHVAGRPKQGLAPWGSFEGWSDLVRSAVVWAGLEDPGLTREELSTRSDTEAQALMTILAGLPQIDPAAKGMSVAEIVEFIRNKQPNTELSEALREAFMAICESDGSIPSNRSIGKRLTKMQGRVVRGLSLASRQRNGISRWFVRSAAGDAGQSRLDGKGGFNGFGGFPTAQKQATNTDGQESAPMETSANKPPKPIIPPPPGRDSRRFSNEHEEYSPEETSAPTACHLSRDIDTGHLADKCGL